MGRQVGRRSVMLSHADRYLATTWGLGGATSPLCRLDAGSCAGLEPGRLHHRSLRNPNPSLTSADKAKRLRRVPDYTAARSL